LGHLQQQKTPIPPPPPIIHELSIIEFNNQK